MVGMVKGLELNDPYGPLLPKPLYDSMNLDGTKINPKKFVYLLVKHHTPG